MYYFIYVRNKRGQVVPQVWHNGLARRDIRVKGELEVVPHLQRTPITIDETFLSLAELSSRYPYNVPQPTENDHAPSTSQ